MSEPVFHTIKVEEIDPKHISYPDRFPSDSLDCFVGVLNKYSVRVLLYLHPVVVTRPEKRGRYRLVAGVESYFLARSVGDLGELPVLLIQKEDFSSEELQLLDQLTSPVLQRKESHDYINLYEYWIKRDRLLLQKLLQGGTTSSVKSMMAGVKPSTYRAITGRAKASRRDS